LRWLAALFRGLLLSPASSLAAWMSRTELV
jgi:hypothetical protein